MLCGGGIFDWDRANARLRALIDASEEPTLWDNPKRAQSILRERTQLERALDDYQQAENERTDLKELTLMAEESNDIAMVDEAANSLAALVTRCKQKETECLFSGEADENDTFLEIHAGAGGTESQDWAEMLFRMYMRFAERHRFKLEMIDELAGEGAGLKSVTIKIKGKRAYGLLKNESGVHRLVRISPFDSNARRHTSFASVWVYPVVDDSIDIVINDKDLRVDTFRASGAGGQHVNKTDSAIRITHLPTNIVVQCQTDRSQHRNRAEALKMLKARLYERELQKRQAELDAKEAQKTDIGWGHQIRSYVLHPYQMVKDLRTGYATSNTSGILDGELDSLLLQNLAALMTGEKVGSVEDLT